MDKNILYTEIFSTKLKYFRKEKQYSQKQVAEMLNVPISTYANWEQGRTQPSIADIYRLLVVLDIEANELFDVN